MIPPAISLLNVHVTRGAAGAVLHGLNLDIEAGETIALVGRSGAGKSTLLKVINGLIVPERGDVIVEGRATRDWNPFELRRRIGYVLQDIGLFPHLTVGENVAVVPRLLGWEPPRIARRVDEMLELVALPPATTRRDPRWISGGRGSGVARAPLRGRSADPADGRTARRARPVTRAELHANSPHPGARRQDGRHRRTIWRGSAPRRASASDAGAIALPTRRRRSRARTDPRVRPPSSRCSRPARFS